MVNRVPILFPIETITRELDYRTVLAALVARRDNVIFLGRKDLIYKLGLECRGGIYLGQFLFGLQDKSRDKYEALKRRGFYYVNLNEEGAVYRGSEADWLRELDRRFDPRLLDADDELWCWGEFQANHYRSVGSPCENIRVTGHPRFDLIKPPYRPYFAEEADRLRRELGRFMLINTNFSVANHALGVGGSFDRKLGFDPRDPMRCRRHIRLFGHMTRKLVAFIELAQALATRFADYVIVVRPHPGERLDVYAAALGGVPGIVVRRDGPVIAWLMAADVLINDGCTTALEASPFTPVVVNYRPVRDPEFDLELPQEVGVACASENEVVHAIAQGLAKVRDLNARPSPRLRAMLANMATDFDAFAVCAGHLQRLQEQCRGPRAAVLGWRERARPWVERFRPTGRASSERAALKADYDRVKFPGIEAASFGPRFERALALFGASARHNVVGDGVVVIEGLD
jgi:surface carbohydrate biosynthesis protein